MPLLNWQYVIQNLIEIKHNSKSNLTIFIDCVIFWIFLTDFSLIPINFKLGMVELLRVSRYTKKNHQQKSDGSPII